MNVVLSIVLQEKEATGRTAARIETKEGKFLLIDAGPSQSKQRTVHLCGVGSELNPAAPMAEVRVDEKVVDMP